MAKKAHETVTWVKPRRGIYTYCEDGAHKIVAQMNSLVEQWLRLRVELENERENCPPPTEKYSAQVRWISETEFFFILRCVNLDEFDKYRRYWTVAPKPLKTVHSCRYYVKLDGSIVQSKRRGYKVLETPIERVNQDEMERFQATGEVPETWIAEWIKSRLVGCVSTSYKQSENES